MIGPTILDFVQWVVSIALTVGGFNAITGKHCLNLTTKQFYWLLFGIACICVGIAINS